MAMKIIYAFLLTIVLTALVGYPVLWLMKKLKAKQCILSYVDIHKGKSGTPTIGGLMFILPVFVISMIFGYKEYDVIMCASVMLAYGIIGFLDDYIKISHHENQGLKAYQKIIAQSGVAVLVAVYCYLTRPDGYELILPFTDQSVNIGWWSIPLVFLLFIATTNASNLLDGLDGLCTGVSTSIFATLSLVCLIMSWALGYNGNSWEADRLGGISIFSACMVGGLLVFMCFNCFPAKIFMGDTGSLAIGGAMACVFAFSGQMLLIFLLGLMLVVTCMSVIIQVVYFKCTHGKRVWLMTPLHHHYQYKGVPENRIVAVYVVVTVLLGVISLISVLRGEYV